MAARPAWNEDFTRTPADLQYKSRRPARRVVAGQSFGRQSVDSLVAQEGVDADEAAGWLGLGARRRDPADSPPPPRQGGTSLREARGAPTHAGAAPTHAAGEPTARRHLRTPAARYQREGPVAAPSEPEPPAPPPPRGPVSSGPITQQPDSCPGRRHFEYSRTPSDLLVWDESAHEAAAQARKPTARRVPVRARQGAPASLREFAEAVERAATERRGLVGRIGVVARTPRGRVVGWDGAS
jgi:hypothetical protein